MRMIRLLGGVAASVAMLGMAVPASAQSWGRGPYRGYHGHYHGDRIDGGDVLLGALLAGGIIAVAAAASKPRAPVVQPYDAPPPPPPPPAYDTAPPPPAYDAPPPPPGDGSYEPGPNGYEPAPGAVSNADEAADACAAAAEGEGTHYARLAHVLNIASVDPQGGDWAVRGTLELRDSYRSDGTTRGFRCMIVGNSAPDVRIDGINR